MPVWEALLNNRDWDISLDPLQPSDLAVYTGRTFPDLLRLTITARGSQRRFKELLGSSAYRSLDNGYWLAALEWSAAFYDQYRYILRKYTLTIANMPELDKEKLIAVVSKALGIDAGKLLYYVEHREDIEQFLANNMQMLGTMAQMKLWDLIVNKEDAPTIRWYLSKTNDLFKSDGSKNLDFPRSIKIIDVTDDDE